MIIHKIQGWPHATKQITTNKMTTSRNYHQQYQQLQPARTISRLFSCCLGQQQQTALHTPQIPPSPPQGTSPTKTGRLIQPNNMLKVITANVQSVSPKIDELIALIQVENFDVIALNET